MKKYISLLIAIIALGAGSYFAQRQFLASSAPPTTTSLVATTSPEVKPPETSATNVVGPAPAQRAPAATVAKPANTPAQKTAATSSVETRPNVTISIASTTYGVYAPAGSTVLDAMRSLASSSSFTFTGRDFPSLGFFVESINGKKNGDGNYWFLYVNGKSSDTGASQTTLKTGDAVEWKYEKSH